MEAYAYLCASFVGLYVYDGCVRLARGMLVGFWGRIGGRLWAMLGWLWCGRLGCCWLAMGRVLGLE